MKIRILKDHENIKAGTEFEVTHINSNHYGVAAFLMFGPVITLPDLSYLEKVVEAPPQKPTRSPKANEKDSI